MKRIAASRCKNSSQELSALLSPLCTHALVARVTSVALGVARTSSVAFHSVPVQLFSARRNVVRAKLAR
jgi:hypothetical protein